MTFVASIRIVDVRTSVLSVAVADANGHADKGERGLPNALANVPSDGAQKAQWSIVRHRILLESPHPSESG